jgi:inner membrane protein
MEAVTQVLASVALARAGLNRATRFATPMLIAGALAPDLDLLSSLGGADAYLRYHRTLFHSIAGGVVVAAAIACAAVVAERSSVARARPDATPVKFSRAFLLCLAGVAFHILLDLLDTGGVQLFWPFHPKWFAWDLAAALDPWILTVLIAALLLPELFGLVSDEIGERRRKNPARQRWAIGALALISIYCVARGALHSRAIDVISSRTYRGNISLDAGAFPSPVSPMDWRGVVSTDNALIELDVPLGASGRFDPESGVLHFKPEPSPALDAARRTAIARRFLAYARFPLAALEPREDSFHFELRDLRFPADSTSHENLIAVVDLDSQFRVLHEELRFPARRSR